MSKLHYTHVKLEYAIFIWVCTFHLGMLFAFWYALFNALEYALFINVCANNCGLIIQDVHFLFR